MPIFIRYPVNQGITSPITIGSIDGNGAFANGASMSSAILYLQSASASVPGLVNTTTQSFNGAKSFLTTANFTTVVSRTANPSASGFERLAVSDTISWRNNANSSDLPLGLNASDQLTFNSSPIAQPTSELKLEIGNGHGSTNTCIRRYSTIVYNVGSDMTYSDSATLGMSVVINKKGMYNISVVDARIAGSTATGISINSNQLTTSIVSITNTNRLACALSAAGSASAATSITKYCAVNDVIRCHDAGNADQNSALSWFSIARVSD